MDRGQREYFLRQQLKAIQEELGEVDEQEAEAQELREQLEEASLPEHARKQAERELQRFERLPPQSAEHGVIRTYLEWLASLPWSKSTEDNLDLKHARKVLDRDHYDIERVKDRILEFLAVRKLKPDARSSILCFVGPPGRGQDLARAARSPRPWGARSSASRWAACATSRRSAATAAPTSARCPARSSARCATPARTTRC